MSPTVMPGFSSRRRAISPASFRASRCFSEVRLGLTICATGRRGEGNSFAATPAGARYPMSAHPAPREDTPRGPAFSCVCLSHETRATLARHVEEPAHKTLAVAHGGGVAAQLGIKAKTAT